MHKATDDSLESVFGTLGYDPNYLLHDAKLVLGYATVALAAGLFYVDKQLKVPFNEAKTLTTAIVAFYGVLLGILLLVNHKFKQVNYVGVNPETKKKIYVSSWYKDPEPIYYVKIAHENGETHSLEVPFNKFFDYSGRITNAALADLLKEGLHSKKDQ